jgi:hypothetical protein
MRSMVSLLRLARQSVQKFFIEKPPGGPPSSCTSTQLFEGPPGGRVQTEQAISLFSASNLSATRLQGFRATGTDPLAKK